MSILGRGIGSSLLSTWDSLRSSYWFVPMLMAALASGLALGLIELDAHLVSAQARRLPWIQDAGAEGTRALLSTVAGSMITVTGVVFSITIVALTLASSQFGPRLLRNFLRDRGNQFVLGTFVATFLYSLLVLRAVETGAVPYVATAVALALAVTSVFVLIYFVHHSASSIQAASVIASVAQEIDRELASLFPEKLGSGAGDLAPDREAAPRQIPEPARAVRATAAGYVRVVAAEDLLAAATGLDLQIELLARPGDFVAEDSPLARVAPADRASEEAACRVRESFVIGAHRTAVQDLAFLTDQLAEMAVRALSPGTNDPNTAIACIHRLGAVVASVAGREMPAAERFDEQGRLRVIAPPSRFEDIVASCFDSLRRYGVGDAAVVEAALDALAGAARSCPVAARRQLLLEHAREWVDGHARGTDGGKRDAASVGRAFARVEDAVAGGGEPER